GLQRDRSLEYAYLLGRMENGVLKPRTAEEILKMEVELINQALNTNHRVTFVGRDKPAIIFTEFAEQKVASSLESPSIPHVPVNLIWQWTRGVERKPTGPSKGAYYIYELTKKASTTQPNVATK